MLFINKVLILLLVSSCFVMSSAYGQNIPIFQEMAGLVVIEIESADISAGWELDTTISRYTGEGYLHYKGVDYFNNPGNALLTYQVAIQKPGQYRFQWRSRIAQGTDNTEHNDSWLRCKDASDFYGQKDGNKIYPKGTGKTPNPNGSSVDGWMKVYQNQRATWTWQTRTSDHDPHNIFVEFDTVGLYTIEISGRSRGHAIDRLVLYHSDVSSDDALTTVNPESEQVQTTAITELATAARLEITPTLATDFITLGISNNIHAGQYEVLFFDVAGQPVQSFSFHKTGGAAVLTLPISQFLSGNYFVQLRAGQIQYQGRFIKL